MAKKANSKTLNPRKPTGFADIQPGDVVLSFDEEIADGFWPAIVQTVRGNDVSLKWSKRLERRPFRKPIGSLALIWPGQEPSFDGEVPDGAEHPILWSQIQIGSVTLAQEDGPIGQYWIGKVVEQPGEDQFLVQWVGYPEVPPVARARHSLALLPPAETPSIKLRQPKQPPK